MAHVDVPEELRPLAKRFPAWLRDLEILIHVHVNRIGVDQNLSYLLGKPEFVEREMGGIGRVREVLRACRTKEDWATALERLMLGLQNDFVGPVERIPFPEPPFPDTAGLKAIISRQALKREGRRMLNCASNRLHDVLNSVSYFYHWTEFPEATVCLRREDDFSCRWQVEDIRTFDNAEPTKRTSDAITKELAAALGNRFITVPYDPFKDDGKGWLPVRDV
jgi:hypothetical protein